MSNNSFFSFLDANEPAGYTPDSGERVLAMLSHILTLVSSFIIPLLIWLIKKDSSPYVVTHAKESLNFQISIFIYCIISGILMLVIIGFFLLWLIGIVSLVLVIVATVRASEDKIYRYPFNLRLIK